MNKAVSADVKEEGKKVDRTSPSIEMTDGNGTIYNIVNFNNPEMCQQTGVIELKAIKGNRKKASHIMCRKRYDQNTDITYGIPLQVDQKTKELIFKQIILEDNRQFDLSKVIDRKEWCVISRMQFIKGSPLGTTKALYKVLDHEAAANNILLVARDKRRATEIASNLTGAELNDMATNIGMNPFHNSQNVLLGEMVQRADENPGHFLAIYENANRQVLTVFKRCLSVGLVRSDIAQGFLWKDTTPLGMSEALAIGHISKNPALLTNMDLESKAQSAYYQKDASEEEKQAIKVDFKVPTTNPNETGFMSDKAMKDALANMNAEAARTKDINDRMEAALAKMEAPIPQAAKIPVETPVTETSVEEVAIKEVSIHDIADEMLGTLSLSDLKKVATKLGYPGANKAKKSETLILSIIARRKE